MSSSSTIVLQQLSDDIALHVLQFLTPLDWNNLILTATGKAQSLTSSCSSLKPTAMKLITMAINNVLWKAVIARKLLSPCATSSMTSSQEQTASVIDYILNNNVSNEGSQDNSNCCRARYISETLHRTRIKYQHEWTQVLATASKIRQLKSEQAKQKKPVTLKFPYIPSEALLAWSTLNSSKLEYNTGTNFSDKLNVWCTKVTLVGDDKVGKTSIMINIMTPPSAVENDNDSKNAIIVPEYVPSHCREFMYVM